MWFKNLIVYRLPDGWSMAAADLEDKMRGRTLQPCGSFDMQSRGWVAPGPGPGLVHALNGHFLIALGVEQKLLPGSIIKQVAAERAVLLEEQQGYPVGRRQMRELRERVTEELRARALSRRRITRAWIDPTNGWFVVDAAGAPRAEELVETLRDTLGTLPVVMLETERSPQAAMAAWLMLGDAPLRFAIDQDLELQSIDKTKATVRYARHPLDGKEIQAHLNAGKYATRLGLTWNDRVAFVLTEKMELKRIQFLEMIKEAPGGEEKEKESAEEQFDIDFILMAGELGQLLSDIQAALGGAPAQQAAAA